MDLVNRSSYPPTGNSLTLIYTRLTSHSQLMLYNSNCYSPIFDHWCNTLSGKLVMKSGQSTNQFWRWLSTVDVRTWEVTVLKWSDACEVVLICFGLFVLFPFVCYFVLPLKFKKPTISLYCLVHCYFVMIQKNWWFWWLVRPTATVGSF